MIRFKKSWLGKLLTFLFCKKEEELQNTSLDDVSDESDDYSIPGGGIKNPNDTDD